MNSPYERFEACFSNIKINHKKITNINSNNLPLHENIDTEIVYIRPHTLKQFDTLNLRNTEKLTLSGNNLDISHKIYSIKTLRILIADGVGNKFLSRADFSECCLIKLSIKNNNMRKLPLGLNGLKALIATGNKITDFSGLNIQCLEYCSFGNKKELIFD